MDCNHQYIPNGGGKDGTESFLDYACRLCLNHKQIRYPTPEPWKGPNYLTEEDLNKLEMAMNKKEVNNESSS